MYGTLSQHYSYQRCTTIEQVITEREEEVQDTTALLAELKETIDTFISITPLHPPPVDLLLRLQERVFLTENKLASVMAEVIVLKFATDYFKQSDFTLSTLDSPSSRCYFEALNNLFSSYISGIELKYSALQDLHSALTDDKPKQHSGS
jgi:hypothetical protein